MTQVYLDDIIVYTPTFDEHQKRLKVVLSALEKANQWIKPSKCYFGFSEVMFLGHVVSSRGLSLTRPK